MSAGAHDFVQFACAACHGSLGRGGVSPYVPALRGIGKALTVATLTRIIPDWQLKALVAYLKTLK